MAYPRFWSAALFILGISRLTLAAPSWEMTGKHELSAGLRAFLAAKTLSAQAENAPESWVTNFLEDTNTAKGLARPWPEVQYQLSALAERAHIPSLKNKATLRDAFISLRDDRFLKDDEHVRNRRLPWFFPDDGCFLRAEAGGRHLRQLKKVTPVKIFAFGELRLSTRAHPEGSVKWWYHVASLVQVSGKFYVLDPAVNPSAALEIADWLSAFRRTPIPPKISICSPATYTPVDVCWPSDEGVAKVSNEEIDYDRQRYLDSEWARIQELGWDPAEVLGDKSPFLKNSSTDAASVAHEVISRYSDFDSFQE